MPAQLETRNVNTKVSERPLNLTSASYNLFTPT